MKYLNWVAAVVLLLGTTVALAQAPSDAQIADVVLVADQVDIDAGKLAESRGHSQDVRSFGKDMVTDHSAVNKQQTGLPLFQGHLEHAKQIQAKLGQ